MGEHNLNLPRELRDKIRANFERIKNIQLPPDRIYLRIGQSNIGRNKRKREIKKLHSSFLKFDPTKTVDMNKITEGWI